jgi:hypothetical protein
LTTLEVARHKHCAIHRVPQRVKIEQAARRATGKISGAHRGRNGILIAELFEQGGDARTIGSAPAGFSPFTVCCNITSAIEG